jgi:hypothetical protein
MVAMLDRYTMFVEQPVRAGAFDVVERTPARRRLVEAGRVSDTATAGL